MSNSSPIQSFFRKAKLQLFLPSRGTWYPKDTLITNADGSIDVFSMTATDDIKFKASEANFSSSSTYDIIKSCAPGIKSPDQMPTVDLDILLLAIRKASYGDDLMVFVDVPKTSMKRELKFSIAEIIEESTKNQDHWDDNLIITNSSTGEELVLRSKPNTLASYFSMTRTLIKQNQAAIKVAENADMDDDVKMDSLGDTIKDLGDLKIKLILDSIIDISMGTFNSSKPAEVEQLIRNLDVEYFKEIEKHLTRQRKKYGMKSIPCISTSEEVTAGAPATWNAEISFINSNFFKVDESSST